MAVLDGHQIDGFCQFFVADGSVSLSYGPRFISMTETREAIGNG